MKRASRFASALVACALVALSIGSLGACTGNVGSKPGAGQGGDSATGDAGSTGNPGTGGAGTPAGTGGTAETPPFEASGAAVAVRKVKNLLTGLPSTDAEVAAATSGGAGALKTLINGWMSDAQTRPLFQNRMIGFFRNFFQQ